MVIRIFRQYLQLPLVILGLVELLLSFGALYAGALLRFGESLSEIERYDGELWPRAIVFALIMFIATGAVGLYSARQRIRLIGLITRLIVAILGGVFLIAIVFYVFPNLYIGRGVLVWAALISLLGALIGRVVLEHLVNEDILKRRILVYGTGARANSIAQLRRRSDRRGFMVLGYIRAANDIGEGVPADQCIEQEGSLLALCDRLGVDEIVVAMDDRRGQFPMHELLECRLDGIEITELVSFFERESGKLRLDMMNPSWIIFSDGFRQGRIHAVLERVFDLVASFLLLVLASPLMVLAYIAIKLEDGWKSDVFYGQLRVGAGEKNFRLLKFRSMRADAEKGGAVWAVQNDPRVTRVGAFMRKTRIDELPQILCVLRGQMSFVGPRPERPEFVSILSEKIPYFRERHTIKPGITGWAQLCYPYGSSDQDAIEKLQYDLYYVKNHTLLLYIAILVQTVEVVLWRKGAR